MKPLVYSLCLAIVFAIPLARSDSTDLAQPTEFQVYSSFDTDIAHAAMARLTHALQPLGFTPVLNIAPYRRSLAMANSKGDAELMRVADLQELAPELTDHLIRVDTPIITARFFAVVPPEGPVVSDIKALHALRVGIHKSIFILEQMFPNASIHSNLPALYLLLKSRHLDAAIVGGYSKETISNYQNFDQSFVVTKIFEMPLYLYLNERHRDLVSLTANGLLLAP